MTPEEKLGALLHADAAPARDLAFSAAVMTRVARRRAWLTAAASLPWAMSAGVALWALHPMLRLPAEAFAGDPSGALATAGAILATTAVLLCGAGLVTRRLVR